MSFGAAAGNPRRPDAADEPMVERAVRALDLAPPVRTVAKLAGGRSGSQVFLLQVSDGHAVLKTTEDPVWQDRANRELGVYRELSPALPDFLPQLRASRRDLHAVRLLLTAYRPSPPAVTLTHGAWVAVADRLGRLHGAPVPPPSWLSHRPWPSADQVTEAVRLWDGYGLASLAGRAGTQLAALRGADPERGLGTVVTHGDCHLGNLLRAPGGGTLWADWQEVCLSSGLDDLVFLWQRAEFEGAHPPREAMTSAYAGARGVVVDDALRAALTAAELRLLLVAWPPFLGYGTQQHRQVMVRRLRQLVEDRG